MTNYKPIIKDFPFNKETPENIAKDGFYVDWPVVYLINNDDSIYIGETYHSPTRMKQHLANPEKKDLKELHIIASDDFTKSSTLDIESSLIDLFYADKEVNHNKYNPLNKNAGLVNHNYHDKNEFRQDSNFFLAMWNELQKRGLVKGNAIDLKNSDLFKYSPYKALNAEQCVVRDGLLEDIKNNLSNNESHHYFVDGSAGTGKTILALYLLRLLTYSDPKSLLIDYDDDLGSVIPEYVQNLIKIKQLKPDLKVGYVVAMESLRRTLKNVCKSIDGLKANMIIGPGEVINEKYDVLIVDEAHRLKQRINLDSPFAYKAYDDNNKKLGLDADGNQLDWVISSSQIQIFFYDSEQSIKPTDISEEKFRSLMNAHGQPDYELSSQMRCLAGNDYIKYVKEVLREKDPERIEFNNQYVAKLVDTFDEFLNIIKEKENRYHLSRIVAGYGYEWISKTDKEKYDIVIEGHKLQWNVLDKSWPLSISGDRVTEEVGCVHTIQGYDLNYCGVIFGPEITYRNGHIVIDRSKYYDTKGKSGIDNEKLKEYILNIYAVLMTRGIHGTYIYVTDEELRNYLKKYF